MPRRRKTALGLGLVAAAGSISWWATGLLDGPWGMLPGGRFDGPGVPCAAADWEAFSAVPEVEVEVWPASPRSVKTWSVVHGGQLYLPADFLTPWKRWPYQVMEDDRLRLRFDGRIFECPAERVNDAALIEQLRLATAAKYDLEPGGRAASVEVWWFRVGPR